MNDARNEVQVDHSIGEISPTLWVLFNFPRLQNSRFFFLKISKEIGNAWRKSLTGAKRASLTHPCSRPFV